MRTQFQKYTVVLMSTCLLIACGNDKRSEDSGATVLQQNKTVSGSIATVGEVDWYQFPVTEADSVLRVHLTSNTYRADVDLLATLYELDANGEKVRLYADHAPEDSQLPANVNLSIAVDTPKNIYIAVRDLMDDEASSNPYYLSVDLSDTDDGNDSFIDASLLVVDDSGTCQNGSVGYIGDVDSYTFEVATNGIFQVLTEFSPFSGGTDVSLNIKLYDANGAVIESLSQGQGNRYAITRYLTAGTYYVLAEDFGRDHFDTSSSFRICLNSVASDEANGNDQQSNASSLTAIAPNTYAVSGSLDYRGDQDWYQISPSAQVSGEFQVLDINFDTADSTSSLVYQIEVRDAAGSIILAHNHNAGSNAFQAQLKIGAGDLYLSVSASADQIYAGSEATASPYTANLQVLDVDDPAERDEANNSINTADALAATSTELTGWTMGKIAYRGDEDWYSVTTDTATYQVLELFLETDAETDVEYSVAVMRDNVDKRLADMDGSDGPTNLKTSLLIEPTESGAPLTYYIKVGDYQTDDGDSVNGYRIRANIRDIPAALPADTAVSGTVHYYSEIDEQSDALADDTITLEHNSSSENDYLVNVTELNFNGDTPNPAITSVSDGTTTTFTFPWVAGYVDYQGDQDWFKLDLNALSSSQDSVWYYDIKVDLHVGTPGSEVEYVWKLYRDRGQNKILVDGVTTTGDGFFASAGDTGTEPQAMDIATPSGAEPFWANQDWAGAFYFSISDFNYIAASLPDDDWGHDMPYYFRVTLVYHPGVQRP